MQRWIKSVRGSRPKIASGRSSEPAASPSRVVTFTAMSRSLLLGRLRVGGRIGVLGRGRLLTQAEFARLGRILRQRLLDGVAYRDPATLRAWHRALNQDEAAL